MLSKRLQAVAAEIPQVSVLADIGTDHGFLVVEVIKRGLADRVIATDVSAPSLDKARRNVDEAGIISGVEYRLGFGTDVLKDGEAQCIVIAGMGGQQIIKILDGGKGAKTYVLSPQSNVREVRTYLVGNGYKIVRDYTVASDGKFYVIIRATRGKDALSRLERAFGRTNITEPSNDFRAYIAKMEERYFRLKSCAKGAAYDEVSERLEDIEQVKRLI